MLYKKYKPIFWLTIMSFLFFIQSCGPSATDIKKQEQKLVDSTLKATEQRTLQIVDSTKKATEQKTLHVIDSTNKVRDSLSKRELEQHRRAIDKTNIKSELLRLDSAFEVQRAKLEDIEGFHLGRMPADKEKQINQQVAVINSIKQNIANLKDILQKIESGQDYKILPSPRQ
jgi:hypothetical protein